MNPSTAVATVVVDELVLSGVREAVLSPGSRSAPLALALYAAEAAGRLRLHVRIDERTAGFLALGLAKASGTPVAVVTTSGTAAVNLHPAVVEADHASVPLVVLTADRPAELRGTGANQTIDQVRLYGGSVRFFADVSADGWSPLPEQARGYVGDSVSLAGVRRLVHWAVTSTGPSHLNVAFREPLLPDGDPSWSEALDVEIERIRTASAPWAYGSLETGPRTVVVAGDGAQPDVRSLAAQGGWPLLAEPSSGHRSGPNALAAYRLLLDELGPMIERVVVAGRPTLSRAVTRLLAREGVEVVRLRADPGTPRVAGDPTDEGDWLRRWCDADTAARAAIGAVLAGEPLNGPSVAAAVAAAVPPDGLLVAGSSSAIRDLDLVDPWEAPPQVLANRGASGIDGTVSTAVGAALAHGGPAYALLGDLTFLHDATGLVVGPDEPRPDLTVVVVNDDGGGLFTLLEQGAPEHAGTFERLFGTPHGTDLAALCAGTGTAYARAASLDDLRAELERPPSGTRVLEVPVDRSRTRDLHRRLAEAVAAAVG